MKNCHEKSKILAFFLNFERMIPFNIRLTTSRIPDGEFFASNQLLEKLFVNLSGALQLGSPSENQLEAELRRALVDDQIGFNSVHQAFAVWVFQVAFPQYSDSEILDLLERSSLREVGLDHSERDLFCSKTADKIIQMISPFPEWMGWSFLMALHLTHGNPETSYSQSSYGRAFFETLSTAMVSSPFVQNAWDWWTSRDLELRDALISQIQLRCIMCPIAEHYFEEHIAHKLEFRAIHRAANTNLEGIKARIIAIIWAFLRERDSSDILEFKNWLLRVIEKMQIFEQRDLLNPNKAQGWIRASQRIGANGGARAFNANSARKIIRLIMALEEHSNVLEVFRNLLGFYNYPVNQDYNWGEIFSECVGSPALSAKAWNVFSKILADINPLAPIALACLHLERCPKETATMHLVGAFREACDRLDPNSFTNEAHWNEGAHIIKAALRSLQGPVGVANSREIFLKVLEDLLCKEDKTNCFSNRAWVVHQSLKFWDEPEGRFLEQETIFYFPSLATIQNLIDPQASIKDLSSVCNDRSSKNLVAWRFLEGIALGGNRAEWLLELLQEKTPEDIVSIAIMGASHCAHIKERVGRTGLANILEELYQRCLEREFSIENFILCCLDWPAIAEGGQTLQEKRLRNLLLAAALMCNQEPLENCLEKRLCEQETEAACQLIKLFGAPAGIGKYLTSDSHKFSDYLARQILPSLVITGWLFYAHGQRDEERSDEKTRFLNACADLVSRLQIRGYPESLGSLLKEGIIETEFIGIILSRALTRVEFSLTLSQIPDLLARLDRGQVRELVRSPNRQNLLSAFAWVALDGLVQAFDPERFDVDHSRESLIRDYAKFIGHVICNLAQGESLWEGSWARTLQLKLSAYSDVSQAACVWQVIKAILDRLHRKTERHPFLPPFPLNQKESELIRIIGCGCDRVLSGNVIIWLSMGRSRILTIEGSPPNYIDTISNFSVKKRNSNTESFCLTEILSPSATVEAHASFFEFAPIRSSTTDMMIAWMMTEGIFGSRESALNWCERVEGEASESDAWKIRIHAATRILLSGDQLERAVEIIDVILPHSLFLAAPEENLPPELVSFLETDLRFTIGRPWRCIQIQVQLLLKRTEGVFLWHMFAINPVVAACTWLIHLFPNDTEISLMHVMSANPSRVFASLKGCENWGSVKIRSRRTIEALKYVASEDLDSFLQLMAELCVDQSLPEAEEQYLQRLPILLMGFPVECWEQCSALREHLMNLHQIMLSETEEFGVREVRNVICYALEWMLETRTPQMIPLACVLVQMPILEVSPWINLRSYAESLLQEIPQRYLPMDASAPEWMQQEILNRFEPHQPPSLSFWQWAQSFSIDWEELYIHSASSMGNVPENWESLSLQEQFTEIKNAWLSKTSEDFLQEIIVEAMVSLQGLIENPDTPREHSAPDSFKRWFLNRLFRIASANDFASNGSIEEVILSLVHGIADLAPATCSVGWSQCVERIEATAMHVEDLSIRVRAALGRAIRDQAVEYVGTLIKTPGDAHLKSKIQMACHRWGTGLSISGMHQDMLEAAWKDPYPLQHNRDQTVSLLAEQEEAPSISAEESEPNTTAQDRRLVFSLRQEMARVLSPAQLLDVLTDVILSLPEQCDGCDLATVAQTCLQWLYSEEEEQYEHFAKFKNFLIKTKQIGLDAHEKLRTVALCLGAALNIWRVSADKPLALSDLAAAAREFFASEDYAAS